MKNIKFVTRTVLAFCVRFRLLQIARAGAALWFVVSITADYGSQTSTGKPPLYEVIDLGAWGGEGAASSAASINEAGHIVGTSYGAAFFWDGTMTALEPKASSASDINNDDQIVGAFETGELSNNSNEFVVHAALWTKLSKNGNKAFVFRDLHNNPKFPSTEAQQISDTGIIVGTGFLQADGPTFHNYQSGAFFCDVKNAQTAPDMIYPAFHSGGNAVSAHGNIAACIWEYDPIHKDTRHIVLCRADKSGYQVTSDLGRVPGGGGRSIAFALNGNGDCAGTFATFTDDLPNPTLYGDFSSFRWNKNQTQTTKLPGPLNFPNTLVSSMNQAGDIVGMAQPSQTGHDVNETLPTRAVLWHNGVPLDLNENLPRFCGWTLEKANGINSKGQIVGDGVHFGQHRAFLLNPIKSAP